jgi:hypothetical protein
MRNRAYISLPITPGDAPNLFEGGYSVTTTPDGICTLTAGTEAVGPGANENLQSEITARNGEFIRIPADGNVEVMNGNDGIAFAHMSAFYPEMKGTIDASNRAELGLKLQSLLQGYTGSMTAKLQGAFDVLQVRTPNHNCCPAPCIKEALKDEVHFYFLHDPKITKNTRIYFRDLEKLPAWKNIGFYDSDWLRQNRQDALSLGLGKYKTFQVSKLLPTFENGKWIQKERIVNQEKFVLLLSHHNR